MKLFERYLLACTNQRIPMPQKWQTSLGLSLDATKQEYQELDNRNTPTGFVATITGYRFQQDETLQRGYVHRRITKTEFDVQAKYLISLYLQALYEHNGTDYRPYFSLSTVQQEGFSYITTAPLIRGNKYSLYGSTTTPLELTVYSEAAQTVYQSSTIQGMRPSLPVIVNVEDIKYNSEKSANLDEYLMLKVVGSIPVTVVAGEYKQFLPSLSSLKAKELYPSVGYKSLPYADKLIPALLDMQIFESSPDNLKRFLDGFIGSSIAEKVKNGTLAIYDVDGYIGKNINLNEES